MLPKLKINIFRSGELFSIQDQRIFISGACSRNKKTIFSKQEQVFNFGSTYFSFWEHAPENEIFLSISEKKFHFRSRLYKFGSMNLPIYLSIYLSIYPSIYNSCIFTVLRSYLDVLYVYLYHFIGAPFLVFHCFHLFCSYNHLVNCVKLNNSISNITFPLV